MQEKNSAEQRAYRTHGGNGGKHYHRHFGNGVVYQKICARRAEHGKKQHTQQIAPVSEGRKINAEVAAGLRGSLNREENGAGGNNEKCPLKECIYSAAESLLTTL